jgi:hypothetical protein
VTFKKMYLNYVALVFILLSIIVRINILKMEKPAEKAGFQFLQLDALVADLIMVQIRHSQT